MRSAAGVERAVLLAAFGAGVLAVAGALAAGRVDRPDAARGADVEVTVQPTGELEVLPKGTIAAAASLEPAGAVEGRTVVRNQTGRSLTVRLRARPQIRDLDTLVRVRVRVEGRALLEGELGELRTWSRPVTLASGARARIDVRVWLPGGIGEGYASRTVAIPLELESLAGPG